MKPVLFFIGDIPFTSWGVLYVIGFLATFLWGYLEGKRTGIGGDRVLDLGFWIFLGTMLGARIMYIFDDWALIRNDPVEILRFWNGGYVLYGGIIGGFFTAVATLRIMKIPILKAGDIVLQCASLGLVFGRVGCLLNGCCYGRPTDVPWAITFGDPTSVARNIAGIPVHPTQIYEAAFMLALFGLLVFIDRRKKFDGLTMWMFYMIYAAGRFVIEFFRGDPRGCVEEPIFSGIVTRLFGPQTYSTMTAPGFTTSPFLSVSQFVSIFLFIGAAIALYLTWSRNKKTVSPVAGEHG